MKKIKITAAFLLLVMLFGTFAGCGDSGGDTAVTTAALTDAPEETTEAPVKADLPDVDYNGDTFTVYMRVSDWFAADFDVEEITGDTMDDAIFERNSRVSEKFNIVFEFLRDNDDFGLNTARTAVLAGDSSLDLLLPHARFVFPYALEGLLYDWNTDLPYIDLDKPWWNDDARAAFSLCNRLFAMVGDISYTNLGSTKCMLFNKNILDQLGIESPYPMVVSGEWTMDKMAELTKSAASDLNGDGMTSPTTATATSPPTGADRYRCSIPPISASPGRTKTTCFILPSTPRPPSMPLRSSSPSPTAKAAIFTARTTVPRN